MQILGSKNIMHTHKCQNESNKNMMCVYQLPIGVCISKQFNYNMGKLWTQIVDTSFNKIIVQVPPKVMLVELVLKLRSCLLHALYLLWVIWSKFPNARLCTFSKKVDYDEWVSSIDKKQNFMDYNLDYYFL